MKVEDISRSIGENWVARGVDGVRSDRTRLGGY